MTTFLLRNTLISASLLTLASSLYALPGVPSIANNNYIGGNFGFLKVVTISSELNSLQSKYPLTYSAYIGHHFSKHLGLEAGYGYSRIKASSDNEQATFKFPYLVAKVGLPVGNHMNLYTKLGLAYVSVKSTTTPSANGSYPIPYLGIGADFNLIPHVALNVDASGPSIGVVGLYAISGGVMLKF